MNTKQQLPCGSWPSPLSAADIASSSLRLDRQTAVDGDTVYWVEGRPAEAGRNVLMAWSAQRGLHEPLSKEWNVNSRAHEYGGGAFAVDKGVICFVHDGDRCLYLSRDNDIIRLTEPAKTNYADMCFDFVRNRIVCVRERFVDGQQEPVTELVAVDMSGSGNVSVLQSGHDFYSTPRLSQDGKRMSWLAWDHPCMPWNSTRLYVAGLNDSGAPVQSMVVAGGDDESVFQPHWHDNALYLVSDRSGWWNLYCLGDDKLRALVPMQAEFGLPQWVFGMSTCGFVGDAIYCAYCVNAEWKLGRYSIASSKWQPLDVPYTYINAVSAGPAGLVFIGAGSATAAEIVVLNIGGQAQELQVLRRSAGFNLQQEDISIPEAVSFSTTDNDTAYGFYYPPTNSACEPVSGELPPLIVKSHGGPTAAVAARFEPKFQFWTSRGFGVLDVNYRGSTGYGRAYHQKLDGKWGIYDVDDCIAGARYLAEKGLVDGKRLIITGGSAGGYTTLCALTFHDVFAAGASSYGIGDLEALLRDTHKFEARYLDGLVAPFNGNEGLYRQRSPLYHADKLSCPVIFFQGDEDRAVPPNQAESMVSALEHKGVPVAYILFEGEGHGFRRADTIMRALESELSFYGQLFGFVPAGNVRSVIIKNSGAIGAAPE